MRLKLRALLVALAVIVVTIAAGTIFAVAATNGWGYQAAVGILSVVVFVATFRIVHNEEKRIEAQKKAREK